MHTFIASAGAAGPLWHASRIVAAIAAVVVAVFVIAVLQTAARLLFPRKPKPAARTGSPYAAVGRSRRR